MGGPFDPVGGDFGLAAGRIAANAVLDGFGPENHIHVDNPLALFFLHIGVNGQRFITKACRWLDHGGNPS